VIAGVGPLDVPLGYALAMTVGALVFVPLCVRGVRAMWRGPVRLFAEPFPWWVWGAPLWRAYVRGMVAVGTTFVVDLLAVMVLIWAPDADAVLVAAVSVLVLSLAVGFLLMLTVALFNRPRAVVPPYLRDQPGALAEWFGGRHADTVAR
jgi:hypothetical protein